MPRKTSASRARTRRIGLLGLLLTTLLTPAGIIVGTVTAAALIGGAFHLNRAAPESLATPPHPISVKTGSPQHLSIEHDGKPMVLVMAEDEIGNGGGMGGFDPARQLIPGLAGDSPVRHSTPSGASPSTPMPGGGFAGTPPSGPAPKQPSFAGPPGSGHAPGAGSSPNGGTPPGRPTPPATGGPHAPTVNGDTDTDEPPGVTDAPTTPEKTTPTLTLGFPPLVTPQPTNGPPEELLPGLDTLPGMPVPPQAGNPLDMLTTPSGKQGMTQPHAVPEPSMLGLMLLGVVVMAWTGRHRPDSRRLV